MRKAYVLITSLIVCLVLSVSASASVSSEVVQLDLVNGSITISETDGVVTYEQGETVIQSTGGCLIQQTSYGTTATSNTIIINGGECAITVANLNIESEDAPISVQAGSLTLTLLGDSILTSTGNAGISVPVNTQLKIKGSGSVTVSGGDYAAGIGAKGGNTGSITICDGTVTATGGGWGAGIGGGNRGTGGSITISGGTVVATGGQGTEGLNQLGGAGIGGGSNADSGTIVISGGNVTATGNGTGSYGYGGAGIGGGQKGTATSITISGGTVTATGGRYAAGIGGGYNKDGGNITISGGTVIATSGSGYSNYSTVYGGAGIGGGSSGDGGTIVIQGGEITASSRAYGAGIGGGVSGDGGTITITDGDITATATGNEDECGAGIGGGHCGNGGSITISGGTVSATSYTGAGIGGGLNGNGGTINILGGTITAKATYTNKWYTAGPSAIGGGYTGKGGTVTIANATVTASGDVHAIGGGSLNNEHGCDAISVSNSTMTLSFSDEEGTNYHEEIKNLDMPVTEVAALIGSVPAITVEATSFSGIATYQWYVSTDETDGYPLYEIEGQTSSFANFLMTSDYDGQYVRCTLTNVYGNSAITSLVQLFELSVTQQPTSVDANVGDLTTLSVASSCANVTYQWQKSIDGGETWNNISNGTNSILGISTSLSEDGAQYRCIITATNGDWVASEPATISVESDEITYTVFHYQQTPDGTGYVPVEKEIISSAENSQVVAEVKEYAGFTVNTSLGKHSGTVTTDNGLALSLYYDRNTYSIQFDMNGGSNMPRIDALYGATITEPEVPARYGYVFGGWYADAELSTLYEFTTMPLGGATVYAKWDVVGSGRGIEYTIDSIAIRDTSTLELLDDIPDHGFLVEVSVTNLEATTMDTIVIAHYTSEGQMLGMNYLFANPQIGQTLTFGAYIENEDGNIGIIKAFVLPSLGNPVPLAASAEYR